MTRPLVPADAPDVLDRFLPVLLDAIADAARQARVDFPEQFAHADRIKADPARDPLGGMMFPRMTQKTVECRRCGDPFPGNASERFCTPTCRAEHKAWERRRAS